MRIADPKRFGTHIMVLRKKAGITLDRAAEHMGMDKRMYDALEKGLFAMGEGNTLDLDEEIVDELMDFLPGFSPATSPGVTGPPIRKKDLDADGKPPSDRDRFLRRGEATPPKPYK